MTTDHLHGPWTASRLDQYGYVLTDQDVDHEEPVRSIVVTRGPASPVARDGDEPRMPGGGWHIGDVLYAHDDLDDDPEQIPTLWAQAQAVAAALNTAGGAA